MRPFTVCCRSGLASTAIHKSGTGGCEEKETREKLGLDIDVEFRRMRSFSSRVGVNVSARCRGSYAAQAAMPELRRARMLPRKIVALWGMWASRGRPPSSPYFPQTLWGTPTWNWWLPPGMPRSESAAVNRANCKTLLQIRCRFAVDLGQCGRTAAIERSGWRFYLGTE